MSCDLFLLAGEASGDLQGAQLIEELLKMSPQLKIAAVAGPRMRAHPITCIEPMENLQVMGFIDVFLALPKMIRLFFSLRRKILALKPKAFIGIDYPGFNLHLHRSLSKKGFSGKQIQYVCPSVWAWGKKRILLMQKHLDLVLCFLPFEPSCFKDTNLQAEYVGHPLVNLVKSFRKTREFKSKVLALFPGSRQQEIERNLPLMLKVAQRLKKEDPETKVAVSLASEDKRELISSIVQGEAELVSSAHTYDLMKEAHVAIAKSGTVALELALHQTPTVVQYAIKPLDLFLAQKVFNISLPYYSLPNLILQKEVFRELFGPNLTEEGLWECVQKLWFDAKERGKVVEGCREVSGALRERHASKVAAERIMGMIK